MSSPIRSSILCILSCTKTIHGRFRQIIVQHTFGNIANLKEIANLIKEFNIHRDSQSRIYLIEDCAHLFLDNYEKVDVGKYSDALFFSFA